MNHWKIASIVLIFIIAGLSINFYFQDTVYDLGGGIELKKSVLDDISKEVGSEFTICDINKNRCLDFGKIK